MLITRHLVAVTLSAAFILFSSTFIESQGGTLHSLGQEVPLQDDDRERGISLFEQGDAAGAVQALKAVLKKRKTDIRALHYLGLAFEKLGKTNDARTAHEKSAKLGSRLLTDLLDGISSHSELFSRVKLLGADLLNAAASADKYLKLSNKPSRSKISEWQDRAVILRSFATLNEEFKDNVVFTPNQVTTRARILSKPNPTYTEEARNNQVVGKVILLMILAGDGSVKGIIPIKKLPHGLTEQAVSVASKIKFIPATKDNKPVSQYIRVEYNFNIY